MNSLDRFYNYFIDEGWTLGDSGWVAPDNWEKDLPHLKSSIRSAAKSTVFDGSEKPLPRPRLSQVREVHQPGEKYLLHRRRSYLPHQAMRLL